jgi:cytochrome c553
LIGLPPSPEEVEAFVNSSDPQAFERVVDRLLQSPRFGEKFGRHWLDVVRFSESSGGGRTRIFQEAWRYRDYVIDAFNQDKPFDQFIAEQIAGDLLPTKSVADAKAALTATSLMSIGPINYELQDKELLDMEVVDEQLTVIGKAFMGMTIGCARCHDHKFDPIPTRDYYALAGILKSTKTLNHANVSNPVMRPLPANDQQKQLLAAYAARIAPVQKEIKSLDATLKKLNGQQVATAQKSIPRDQVNGLSVDETEARLIGKWVSSASVAGFVGKAYHYTSDRNAAAHYEFKPGDRGKVEVRLSYTANPNRASNVTVEIWHAGEQTVRKVDMKKAPGIDGSFVSLGTFEFKDSLKVIIKGTGSNGVVIADCVQVLAVSDAQKAGGLASVRGGKGVSKTSKPNASEPQRKEIESRLAELRKQLKDMQKDAPSPVPVVMSVEEAAKPGNCHLCIRGNVHNPGVEVPRGFLSIMTGGKPAEIPDGASGRREFAEWIAGPDNTLTSRVIANRVWYWLTGVGLVRTTDNFGITGETPSHPKLLDWLATELHANGWSIRHLIRTIVLSRTWRLASEPSQAALRIDPDNRLLSHAHRRRLEAESIRDGILSVSGQLDLTAGGSTIRPGSTTEFNYRFNDASLDGRRRSVYVPVFRNTLLDLFEVFDFADPNLTRGRRTTSTLPTQGLYLMNSPWVIEQSQHAAERLLAIEGLSDGERLERAHLQFFGRLPTPAERRLAEQYLAAATDEADRIQVWSELCHVMIASIDFRYLR